MRRRLCSRRHNLKMLVPLAANRNSRLRWTLLLVHGPLCCAGGWNPQVATVQSFNCDVTITLTATLQFQDSEAGGTASTHDKAKTALMN